MKEMKETSKVKFVKRKSLKLKDSGRSTDYITPSFGFGCLYNCSYCYCKRHVTQGLSIATNTDEILNAVSSHLDTLDYPKLSNQTHEFLYTYDISCNEDYCLHLKHHDWKQTFDFFKNENRAMGSMATKYVNEELLSYDPKNKIRIRMSLMPQDYSFILEPNTSSIIDRIKFIPKLIEAGYDAHINFSPVIFWSDSEEKYKELFELVRNNIAKKYRDTVKCEVIFLTHNKKKHQYNLDNNLPGEDMLWQPQIQEDKTSQYGSKNIRYDRKLKKVLIDRFIKSHDEIIPWNTIRYIF